MIRIAIIGTFGDGKARMALAIDEFLRERGYTCSVSDVDLGDLGPDAPRPPNIEIGTAPSVGESLVTIRTFHANRLDDGSFPKIQAPYITPEAS